MRVPGIRTILFTTGQAFAIKRFGFGKPLLAAQRAGQSAQSDLHILAIARVLTSNRKCLAERGFSLSQIASIEESVAAAEKVCVGRIAQLHVPTKNSKSLAAGTIGLGLLAFERKHARKGVERLCHGRILVAEGLLSNGQRLPK